MAKLKTPRVDQQTFEGMAPEINPKVHKAAKWYAKKRDERMVLTGAEKEAKDTLIGVMTEEGLTDYEFKDVAVHIDVKKGVKVEIGGEKKDGEAEE